MRSPGYRPRKGGFMASLQAAMAPKIPADVGGPIVRPPAVTVASVLVLVAGVFLLVIGAVTGTSTGKQVATLQTIYTSAVKQCTDNFGGFGTAVPSTAATPTAGVTTPIPLTALPSSCRQITGSTISASALSSYRASLVVIAVLLILAGLAAAASGWYLREGRKWARRVLIAVVLVQLALAFLFQVSNVLTLLSTLLIVVGLSITFLGRGSAYFIGIALRKKQH